MTITLDEFMKDFTPEERARVAARTAELVEEALTLRDVHGNASESTITVADHRGFTDE